MFDDAYLQSLALSICQVGIQQRLVVRPHGTTKKPASFKAGKWVDVAYYEIVCGECRWRASKIAKLAEVPVDVVDLTDDQVKVIQLIENVQRKDLCVSDEAKGYAELAKSESNEQISTNTGKPLAYIRGMLKLAKLDPEFLAQVDAGRVPRITAELVARVPGEESRKVLSACILGRRTWWNIGEPIPKPTNDGEILTTRETKALIGNCFQLELKKATFDKKSLDLIPNVTSCEKCPKRAGNAAAEDESFKEIRADMCLDPSCFRAKTLAHNQLMVKNATKAGQRVLTAKESAGLFDSWGSHTLNYHSSYVDLDARCQEDKRDRLYKTLVEPHLDPSQVVIAVDPKGIARRLVNKKVAGDVIKKHHKVEVKAPAKPSADDLKWKQEEEEFAEVRKHAQIMAAEKGLSIYGACGAEIIRSVCVAAYEEFWSDVYNRVMKRRGGIEIGDLTDNQAFSLLCELVVTRMLLNNQETSKEPKSAAVLKALDIDLDRIRSVVKKGANARTSAEGKTKDKAKSKEKDETPAEEPWRDIRVDDLELPDDIVMVLKKADFATAGMVFDEILYLSDLGIAQDQTSAINAAIEAVRRPELGGPK